MLDFSASVLFHAFEAHELFIAIEVFCNNDTLGSSQSSQNRAPKPFDSEISLSNCVCLRKVRQNISVSVAVRFD